MLIKNAKPVDRTKIKLILECPYCGFLDSIIVNQTFDIQAFKCKRCNKTNTDSGLQTN